MAPVEVLSGGSNAASVTLKLGSLYRAFRYGPPDEQLLYLAGTDLHHPGHGCELFTLKDSTLYPNVCH